MAPGGHHRPPERLLGIFIVMPHHHTSEEAGEDLVVANSALQGIPPRLADAPGSTSGAPQAAAAVFTVDGENPNLTFVPPRPRWEPPRPGVSEKTQKDIGRQRLHA